MTHEQRAIDTRGVPRHLRYWVFALVIVAYLAIIQLGGIGIGKLTDEDDIYSTGGVVFTMILPLGITLVFTFVVVSYLKWWQPVMRDDKPVRRWVWIVPALLVVAILLATDYGALADKGALFVVALLIATQIVGWGEEGMFRGIGVVMLRKHGLTEGRVALFSSLIFGAVHLTNGLTHGASAIPQAIIVSFAGYFFYLTRRVSGRNALNSVLHGLFDFSLLTGVALVADPTFYPGTLAAFALYPVLAIILLVKRRSIELPASSESSPV